MQLYQEQFKNRFGRIEITRHVIDQVTAGKPEFMATWNAIFCDFVVIRSEARFENDTVRYEGYHPKFDERPEMMECVCVETAIYDANVSRSYEGGVITFSVEFVRRNK